MTLQLTQPEHTASQYLDSDADVKIAYIEPQFIDRLSGEIKRRLERVSNRVELDDASLLLERSKSQHVQFWMVLVDDVWSGLCVTEVVPDESLGRIIALEGEGMETWLAHTLDLITDQMRQHGLMGLEFVGRKGWVKEAEKYGFVTKTYGYRKLN